MWPIFALLLLSAWPPLSYAESPPPAAGTLLDLTDHWAGIACLVIFVIAYGLVVLEEFIHLRKSKPVVFAAGLIWILIAIAYTQAGDITTAGGEVRHHLLEYAELLLFLLTAMTYINTMIERNVFEALRAWLIVSGYSLRAIFWITGLLAFFISPVVDNLTTALIMAAVVIAVGADNRSFVTVACINIVVAANAGGTFSPFGDITTLMVWQKGAVQFFEFFNLFIPALINWLVPAAIMSFTVPRGRPGGRAEAVRVKQGGFIVIGLFFLTIAITVLMHNFLHLPPVVGMMMGLGLLKLYGYRLTLSETRAPHIGGPEDGALDISTGPPGKPFDIFISMKRAEWDTLMFFYGVILCVGGLGTVGYLALASQTLYVDLGPTWANILIGVLSAVVDNIPVMFAVLTMNPDMSHGQWLLVTMTAGVGGSLLSIGSAAGVALMGQARGVYTFFSHLRWSWAVALGYIASIASHMLINAHLM
ncbi:MAG: sodium:proton antiporter NhaD [Gammaproteobacteria bacterium]|nr:sodium:proton antiporter NhaD [Gammaproteobacteria bacterium]